MLRAKVFIAATMIAALASQADAREPRLGIALHAGKSENCYVTAPEGLSVRKGRWMGGDNFKLKGARALMAQTTIVCSYADGKVKTSTAHRQLVMSNAQAITVYLPKNRSDMNAHTTSSMVRAGQVLEWSGDLLFQWAQ
ncbi:hypothetical protein [uncultured Tateyamaria sp.]|uniref:hypothetical protein n=1 Tax=Tateyamaria sp. 1078 TaxID=3417464 RepID=UPI0026089E71|nr:hypothetical protein [uncultured Tateyamaria sp.]